MRKALATFVALLAVVAVMPSSDARAGAFGEGPPAKVGGPVLHATVVTVVGPIFDGVQGWNTGFGTIRVDNILNLRKPPQAAYFFSSYVGNFTQQNPSIPCGRLGYTDLASATEARFLGLMPTFVPLDALAAVVEPFAGPGMAEKATITNILRPSCTVINGDETLSFDAVIQFAR